MRTYGKYGEKASRIVKRHEKYGRKVGNSEKIWKIQKKIVKRHEKYERKVG